MAPSKTYRDRGLRGGAFSYGGKLRGFGIPVVDSLLPDGVPVPCTLLLTADPGSGSDFLRTAMVREHLTKGPEAKVLWLSLESFVDELRNMIDGVSITNGKQVEFIDCYSSQIGVDSRERYSADPSNLPHLGVVTSTAISEIGAHNDLLVVLDSLSSLIQKVGLRCSTEFFRTLVGRTRSIGADLLTTLNRGAFSETTLATFAGIADIVLELTMQDSTSSGGKLRVRKVTNVKHSKAWLPYEIDFDAHTLRCDVMEAIGSGNERFPETLASTTVHQLTRPSINKERSTLNSESGSQFCTVGDRALSERERIAVMAETLSAVGEDYQNSIQVMLDNLSLAKTRMNEKEAANLDVLVHSFSDQIERMNRYFALLQNRNHINPILRQSSIAQTIQRAITDAIVPSNVKVDTVNRTKNALMLDAPMITRALTEVIDAAVREMPTGGLLSIRDQVNANVVEVVVENTGVSQWKGNVTTIFDPESQVDTSTGLGLVIAKRFIEAHKGQLQVTNEEGKGSVFTIKLPANPA